MTKTNALFAMQLNLRDASQPLDPTYGDVYTVAKLSIYPPIPAAQWDIFRKILRQLDFKIDS